MHVRSSPDLPVAIENIPMTPQRHFRLIVLLLFVVVSFLPAYAQEAPLNGFDDYVNKALREWEVPGLAIAIIKDDRIVMAKGYGVRKLGDPTPVDERTLFAIGSSAICCLTAVDSNAETYSGTALNTTATKSCDALAISSLRGVCGVPSATKT
jgi:beta-lactamase family protein